MARNHQIPLEFLFHGIPNCNDLLPKNPIHHPIQGQSIPIIIFLLPNHNLPIMIKTDWPILGLGETIYATTRRGGRTYHLNIVDLLKRRGRDWNYWGKVEKPFLKRPYFTGVSVFFFAGGSTTFFAGGSATVTRNLLINIANSHLRSFQGIRK
jgi:hypothetical protein